MLRAFYTKQGSNKITSVIKDLCLIITLFPLVILRWMLIRIGDSLGIAYKSRNRFNPSKFCMFNCVVFGSDGFVRFGLN